MKLLLSLFLVFQLSVAVSAPPPGYYDPAVGKKGEELRSALHLIVSGHTVIPYSSTSFDTSDALKVLDQDPANTNNVFLLYAQRSEPKSDFGDTSGWNREHMWPNSYGLDDTPPAYSDLFNLRAEDATVNSARGNKFYDTSNTNEASFKVPGHSEAANTSTDFNSWEPPANVKGDIARALFYMDVRYEGNGSNELNLTLTDNLSAIQTTNAYMGRLSTLLQWHVQDPVDASEQQRNDLIYERFQHNRNPFVDHPEWVALVFNPEIKFALLEDSFRISWPIGFPDAVLSMSTNLPDGWSVVAGDRTNTVSEIVEEHPVPAGNNFYRLLLP